MLNMEYLSARGVTERRTVGNLLAEFGCSPLHFTLQIF